MKDNLLKRKPGVVEDILEVDIEVVVEVVVEVGVEVEVEVVPTVEGICSGLQLITRSMVLICSDLHSFNSV